MIHAKQADVHYCHLGKNVKVAGQVMHVRVYSCMQTTGFGSLYGRPVGVVANVGQIMYIHVYNCMQTTGFGSLYGRPLGVVANAG
jgi:acetyl-CoA carboxylase carboxyltransferase component